LAIFIGLHLSLADFFKYWYQFSVVFFFIFNIHGNSYASTLYKMHRQSLSAHRAHPIGFGRIIGHGSS
jgi:hypothetical protein